MYSSEYSLRLKHVLKKLSKKDTFLHERVLAKIEEIITSENVTHYKNLKNTLKNYKRVHIGHFVLIFIVDEYAKTILFEDFDHHDNIYEKKR